MMLSTRLRGLNLFLFLLVLIGGCAAPFKLMPKYEEYKDKIQTIALYPLLYTKDGYEQRLFGMTFTNIFYSAIPEIAMVRPIKFIEPDSTVAIFRSNELEIVDSIRGGIVKGATFPVFKQLSQSDLQTISEEVDGLILCDLIDYNEVGAGEKFVQACGTALLTTCLTGGLVTASYSENNMVDMKLTLFETTTGSPIWEYEPKFSGGLGEQRMNYTNQIITGFRKYFPLSNEFKRK